MKQILFLPSWFPSRIDPYPGDFIKRHAIAASLYNRITVFFTVADPAISKQEIVQEKINENLVIYIYYYPGSKSLLSPVINGLKRYNALKKLYRKIFPDKSPDLVHVHVTYPAGLFALYLNKRKNISYVISEHDGIYMPGYDNYHTPSSFEKRVVPIIFKKAKKIHAVSKSLANALSALRLSQEAVVIPNVVDTDIFNYRNTPSHKGFRFIHVSSMINQKNPEGMIKAMALVKQKRNDFLLTVIGPKKEKLIYLVNELSLSHNIQFIGEIPYDQVANEIASSDAMIHFTRYETFGCVIAEALCEGIPVITSDLPVTRELITDGVNGLLVKEAEEKDLASKIIFFMETGFKINSQEVSRENCDKFNYKRVGGMFNELYYSV